MPYLRNQGRYSLANRTKLSRNYDFISKFHRNISCKSNIFQVIHEKPYLSHIIISIRSALKPSKMPYLGNQSRQRLANCTKLTGKYDFIFNFNTNISLKSNIFRDICKKPVFTDFYDLKMTLKVKGQGGIHPRILLQHMKDSSGMDASH